MNTPLANIGRSSFLSSAFLVCLAGLVGLLCGGCSRMAPAPTIGNQEVVPYAVAAVPGTTAFFLASSAAYALYKQGNLLGYQMGADGKPRQTTVLAIPRNATSAAVSGDGKLLAVAFSGSQAEVRFYDVSNLNAPPVELPNLRVAMPPSSIFGDIQFFSPNTARPGMYYAALPQGVGSPTATVDVFEIPRSGNQTRWMFRLPDSLPGAGTSTYQLGYRAPFFIKSLGLFGVMPAGGATFVLPQIPVNPPDVVALVRSGYAAWANPLNQSPAPAPLAYQNDIRLRSMLVMDFDKIVQGTPLTQALAYVVLAFNGDMQLPWLKGQTVDATKASLPAADPNHYVSPSTPDGSAISTINANQTLQSGFMASLWPNETGCLDKHPPQPNAILDLNTLLTVTAAGEVMALKGMDTVKTQLTKLYDGTGPYSPDPKDPTGTQGRVLFAPFSNAFPLSRTSGVLGFDTLTTFVPRLHVVDTGPSCATSFLRVEADLMRASIGSETSWIELQTDPDPRKPLVLQLPFRGVNGTATLMGSWLLAVSYSYGNIGVLKAQSNNTLQQLN